jgi:hypothetical protein
LVAGHAADLLLPTQKLGASEFIVAQRFAACLEVYWVHFEVLWLNEKGCDGCQLEVFRRHLSDLRFVVLVHETDGLVEHALVLYLHFAADLEQPVDDWGS